MNPINFLSVLVLTLVLSSCKGGGGDRTGGDGGGNTGTSKEGTRRSCRILGRMPGRGFCPNPRQ